MKAELARHWTGYLCSAIMTGIEDGCTVLVVEGVEVVLEVPHPPVEIRNMQTIYESM